MARRRRAAIATRTVYVPKVRYRMRGRRRTYARRAIGFAAGLPPTATAMGGAALLAWGTKEGNFMAGWKVGSLSVAATVGAGAWLAAKFLKWPVLKHIATGMLCVAAYEKVKYGKEGEILGDDGGYSDVVGEADV